MKNFLSCDWGTSSFRLRYVNTNSMEFNSLESSDEGIAATFELWNQSGKQEEARVSFYLDVVKDHINTLEQQLQLSFNKIPLVISGMASSSIGMIEIPYKEVPFKADGSELEVKTIKANPDFDHDILIISGAKTNDDVMRGEETQLAGCVLHDGERLFIFPGTHSKHIQVNDGKVTGFKTYMTGEFFDILSAKSILSGSVRKGLVFENSQARKGFEKGIKDASQSNLLHNAFMVRTNELFKKLTNEENYYYLSGLLIGTELKEATRLVDQKITLVVSDDMKPIYTTGLITLGAKEDKESLTIENADKAVIKGQLSILKRVMKM